MHLHIIRDTMELYIWRRSTALPGEGPPGPGYEGTMDESQRMHAGNGCPTLSIRVLLDTQFRASHFLSLNFTQIKTHNWRCCMDIHPFIFYFFYVKRENFARASASAKIGQ